MKTKPKTYGPPDLQFRVLADGSCRFHYETAFGGFTFSLLSEVGAIWQKPFVALLKKHGLKIAEKAMELPASPWLADTLEKVAAK